MNGVRVDEAFGDTMQWELLPEAAIDRIDLTGANPVFGLNALGSALAIQTKRGLDWRGAEVQALGGSFGRFDSSAEVGVGGEDSGFYAAFESGREGRFDWFANYSFLKATFEDGGELPGAHHPLAEEAEEDDDNGDGDEEEERKVIRVESGDRIPGLPGHAFKAGVGFRPMNDLRVGVNMVARSGVYLRGDESNQLDETSDYAIFNVTADYTRGGFTLFGRIENVFDHDYETFGILGECEEEEGEEGCEGEVPILNHGLEEDVHHTNRFLSPGAPRGMYVGLRYRW